MLKQDKFKEIYDILLDMFPDAHCELNYSNVYESTGLQRCRYKLYQIKLQNNV